MLGLARVRAAAERFYQARQRQSGLVRVPIDRPWAPADYPVRFISRGDPDVILDVGANSGQFGRALRSAGYSKRIVSFEPQPDVFVELKRHVGSDSRWDCYDCALADRDGVGEMHVSGFRESSSLLPIGRLHVDLMPATAESGTVSVPVARLDSLAGKLGVEPCRFAIKLDVQGYELAVLRGAVDTIRHAQSAVVELNFAPLFDGQSPYYEVMEALENAGLRFVALANLNTVPGTADLLWADGMFARAGQA